MLTTWVEPFDDYYLRVLDGLAMALILHIAMLASLTRFGVRFRYLLIFPLVASGLGVAFVMSGYHAAWIPLVFILYFCIIYRIFKEEKIETSYNFEKRS